MDTSQAKIKSLKDLVKEYPELGDALAYFENRITYLDNSISYQQEVKQAKPPEPHFVPVEPQAHMTRIKKLENRVLGIENFLTRKTPPLKKDTSKYQYVITEEDDNG
jgi:hypothetical protein